MKQFFRSPEKVFDSLPTGCFTRRDFKKILILRPKAVTACLHIYFSQVTKEFLVMKRKESGYFFFPFMRFADKDALITYLGNYKV